MVALGRILGGTNKTIESLPLFMSGWSEGRDTAVPPKKSFRQWWDSKEAQQLLESERARGIPDRDVQVNSDHVTEEDN